MKRNYWNVIDNCKNVIDICKNVMTNDVQLVMCNVHNYLNGNSFDLARLWITERLQGHGVFQRGFHRRQHHLFVSIVLRFSSTATDPIGFASYPQRLLERRGGRSEIVSPQHQSAIGRERESAGSESSAVAREASSGFAIWYRYESILESSRLEKNPWQKVVENLSKISENREGFLRIPVDYRKNLKILKNLN